MLRGVTVLVTQNDIVSDADASPSSLQFVAK